MPLNWPCLAFPVAQVPFDPLNLSPDTPGINLELPLAFPGPFWRARPMARAILVSLFKPSREKVANCVRWLAAKHRSAS